MDWACCPQTSTLPQNILRVAGLGFGVWGLGVGVWDGRYIVSFSFRCTFRNGQEHETTSLLFQARSNSLWWEVYSMDR